MNHFFTVSAHPSLRVELCDIGASIRQIYYEDTPMLYTTDPEAFVKPNKEFFSQFVGPVAGRIKDAEIKGFQFVANENANAHHSSTFRFCWKRFNRDILEEEKQIRVIFTYEDELFGGRYLAVIEYCLSRLEPKLTTRMSMTSTVYMPVNLTTHLYFNLGEKNVESIFLKIPSSKRAEYDNEGIPLRFVDVDGQFDLREGKLLTAMYDHAFLLDKGPIEAHGEKVNLVVNTDGESVIVYTDIPSQQRVGHSLGFTLESVQHALLGPDMILPEGITETTTIEYTFSRR